MENIPFYFHMAKVTSRQENRFICAICQDNFTHPVVLTCMHTFCRRCIERHIRCSTQGHKWPECPVCSVGGLTKRSLEGDEMVAQLMNLYEELLSEFETTTTVDLRSVRTTSGCYREAPGDTPCLKKRLGRNTRPSATSGAQHEPVPGPSTSHVTPSTSTKEVPAKYGDDKENASRVVFKKLGNVKNEEDASRKSDEQVKLIPFLQLGRLVPYSDRKEIAVASILEMETKRRRSSEIDHLNDDLRPLSKIPRLEEPNLSLPPLLQRENPQSNATEIEDASTSIGLLPPDSVNGFENRIPPQDLDAETNQISQAASNTSRDLFSDEEDDTMLAGRSSPSPTDIHCSQQVGEDDDHPRLTEEQRITSQQVGEDDDHPRLTEAQGISSQEDSDDDFLFNTPGEPEKRERKLQKLTEVDDQTRKRMTICCTGLTKADKNALDILVQKFDLKQKSVLDEHVTHLVAKVNENNCADRTLKYLEAINRRIWIVNQMWIKDSLANQKLLRPENYEALDMNGTNGPFRARTAGDSRKLFAGLEIWLSGTFQTMKKPEMARLMSAEGAKMARSIHSMSFSKKGLIVIDHDLTVEPEHQDATRHFSAFQIPTVTTHWVFDSMSSFDLKPLQTYLVHRATGEEIESLGYF